MQTNKFSRCSECGEMTLEFQDIDIVDERPVYHWECLNCGCHQKHTGSVRVAMA